MSMAGHTKIAQVYADTVLAVNFADARTHFHKALFEIHLAHTLMLIKQRILTKADGAVCLAAILDLEASDGFDVAYNGDCEDYFFFIERRLTEFAPPDVVARIHTARSRNDIDLTLYRLCIRQELVSLTKLLNDLRTTLLAAAVEHQETIMPAYTHGQPAQPTTLAHYLLAMIEGLERSQRRISASYATVNKSPMGACAITTTGFEIDRYLVAELLAFDGLQLNSYGAIAAVDYLTEAMAAVAVLSVDLGRFVQDLIVMTSKEVRTLDLADGYVQISSIMPQKRNPSALEHCRALLSKTLGECQAITVALHNTPFADMVDGEDDLQPLVFQAFNDITRVVALITGVMENARFDAVRLRKQAFEHFLTVTELADTIVRDGGLSFRAAHDLVSTTVGSSAVIGDPSLLIEELNRRSVEMFGHPVPVPVETLVSSLDPDNFVRVRNRPGGPALEPVSEQIGIAKEALRRDSEWEAKVKERLVNSSSALRTLARSEMGER